MADQPVDEDAALVRAALAYLNTMHQEAAAIVVALETERPRVSRSRRAAVQAPRPPAGHDGSL